MKRAEGSEFSGTLTRCIHSYTLTHIKEKVSLTIEGDIWRQFRAQCIQQRKSASSELEAFMRSRLESEPEEKARPKRKKGGESGKK